VVIRLVVAPLVVILLLVAPLAVALPAGQSLPLVGVVAFGLVTAERFAAVARQPYRRLAGEGDDGVGVAAFVAAHELSLAVEGDVDGSHAEVEARFYGLALLVAMLGEGGPAAGRQRLQRLVLSARLVAVRRKRPVRVRVRHG
jgi:hypothetical protein